MTREGLGGWLRSSRLVRRVIRTVVDWDGWWFDRSRHLITAHTASLSGLTLAGRIEEGCNYVPTLPYRIKRILREIPIQDHSQFTFIDFGSGKGRVLFVAAEYPYRRIQGVEFA